jgi:hypothetical protein
MDNRRFGRAYQDLPEKKLPSNLERRELLEAPREWMRFFNDILKNYLVGNQPPEKEVFIEKMTEYFAWSQINLNTLMKRANEIDDPLIESDISSEFSFHQINGPLTFLWYSLLYHETNAYSVPEIADMQAHLAITMAEPSNRLRKIDENPSIETAKEHNRLKGTLSEADAIIVLMELMKKEPGLIALPAPELFEHNPRAFWRNVDALLIDTVTKQVQGLQVKTNTVDISDDVDKKHYDAHFATVIDSAHELGNTAYTMRHAGRRQNLPGQLALSLLSERPINKPPRAVAKPAFMRSRRIAIELSRGRKPFMNQAVHNLSARILPELRADVVQEDLQNAIENEQIA